MALLLDQDFQEPQKSLPGAIQAASRFPLEPKNSDFAREGCKKLPFVAFLLLATPESDIRLILDGWESPKAPKVGHHLHLYGGTKDTSEDFYGTDRKLQHLKSILLDFLALARPNACPS